MILRAEGVTAGYREPVLRGVTCAVEPGSLLAVVGPNGSGKTTLLRGLLGFLPPLAGRVERRADLRIGYVPQRETLDPLYPLSAGQVVRTGSWRDLPCWRF
jgi:ABC-type Mn2+/Zn2+ transport system ATPase subunit